MEVGPIPSHLIGNADVAKHKEEADKYNAIISQLLEDDVIDCTADDLKEDNPHRGPFLRHMEEKARSRVYLPDPPGGALSGSTSAASKMTTTSASAAQASKDNIHANILRTLVANSNLSTNSSGDPVLVPKPKIKTASTTGSCVNDKENNNAMVNNVGSEQSKNSDKNAKAGSGSEQKKTPSKKTKGKNSSSSSKKSAEKEDSGLLTGQEKEDKEKPSTEDCIKNCSPEAARWAINAILRKASGMGTNFIFLNDFNNKSVEAAALDEPRNSAESLGMGRAVDTLKWSMYQSEDASVPESKNATAGEQDRKKGGGASKTGSGTSKTSSGGNGGTIKQDGKASTNSSKNKKKKTNRRITRAKQLEQSALLESMSTTADNSSAGASPAESESRPTTLLSGVGGNGASLVLEDQEGRGDGLFQPKLSQRQKKKFAATKGMDLAQTLDSIAKEFRKSQEKAQKKNSEKQGEEVDGINNASRTTTVLTVAEDKENVTPEADLSKERSTAAENSNSSTTEEKKSQPACAAEDGKPKTTSVSSSITTERTEQSQVLQEKTEMTRNSDEPDVSSVPNGEELIEKALEGDKIAQALCKSNKVLLAAIRFRKGAAAAAARAGK
ncbi:unnamed protein product [Amoebophrya sp. A120]|nr:unnamed protein product [Amoebophrya sp. A120]|eukprot:GSA120T00012695001.1